LIRHLVVDFGTARANRKLALVDGKMMRKSPNIDTMHARQVCHPATVRRKASSETSIHLICSAARRISDKRLRG
jgi:hypothetical protein